MVKSIRAVPLCERIIRFGPKMESEKEKLLVPRVDLSCIFAIDLENITQLDFYAPSPELPKKCQVSKLCLSQELDAMNHMHSYMSMPRKLKLLSLEKLRELCEKAEIPENKFRKETKRVKLAKVLLQTVEAAEKEKPPVLSTTEIMRILTEKNVKGSSSLSLKERFAKLTLKSLIEIADAKRIDIPLSPLNPKQAKKELINAIWKEKDSYEHRLRSYRTRRQIQDMKPMRTVRGIKNYCKLRKDIESATIRSIRFRVKPHTYFIEDVFLMGIKDKELTFCGIPTLSSGRCSKYKQY